jgi:hypothetical protein
MTHSGKRLQMLDADIQGRLQSLDREHLAALLDYMLGDTAAVDGKSTSSRLLDRGIVSQTPETKTPDASRG